MVSNRKQKEEGFSLKHLVWSFSKIFTFGKLNCQAVTEVHFRKIASILSQCPPAGWGEDGIRRLSGLFIFEYSNIFIFDTFIFFRETIPYT